MSRVGFGFGDMKHRVAPIYQRMLGVTNDNSVEWCRNATPTFSERIPNFGNCLTTGDPVAQLRFEMEDCRKRPTGWAGDRVVEVAAVG